MLDRSCDTEKRDGGEDKEDGEGELGFYFLVHFNSR